MRGTRRMKRFFVLLGILGALIALGAAVGIATVMVTTPSKSAARWERLFPPDISPEINMMMAPVPLEAKTACLTARGVLLGFGGATRISGGFVVGVEYAQAFASLWRRRMGDPAEIVTAVIAHIFPIPNTDADVADVVEFDAKGCAMSRTKMSAALFDDLVEESKGASI